MSDDDVRRALSAYAAATPDLDPRAGLAGRLARRQRVRQTAIAGTAVLAAVVTGTGVAALDRGDRGTVGVLAVDTPSATPSADATPTASPATTPASRPSPTQSGPSGGPTATTAPPVTDDPGPVTVSAGGESGLRVVATVSSGGPATAKAVTLKIEARDDDGRPQVTSVHWGDTQPRGGVAGTVLCSEQGSPSEKVPGSAHQTVKHAWRNPGDYTVTVTVTSEDPCDSSVGEESHTLRIPVAVRPGEVTSNGPQAPYTDFVGHMYGEDENATTVTLEWTLRDYDGYIGSLLADWGDGSAPERVRNTQNPCEDGDGDYYPPGTWSGGASHEYEPGEYTVTLTFASTGCDGEDRQRAPAKTYEVVVR
jgi:hypothetical protein